MRASPNTSTGHLVVSVSTARAVIPLENALVTVSALDADGSPSLLLTTRTNRCGQTAVLPLPAPPQGNSTSPGSDAPYARYSVAVTLDGYTPISSNDLTIFADIVATLPVYLVPLEENVTPPGTPDTRTFPPHNLNKE